MKKATTISLALLLLLLSARDLVTFAAFKLQQQTIAAELCVNKYELIPMCVGSCFLDLQITEDIEQNTDPFASWLASSDQKPVYFQASCPVILDRQGLTPSVLQFFYQDLESQAVLQKILQPPRH